MAHVMPPIAKAIFVYFEPLTGVAGLWSLITDTSGYINGMVPGVKPHKIHDNEAMVAMQLGSILGALSLLGLFVLGTTKEASTCRAFIFALWFGDLGHLATTFYNLGWEKSLDIANWNTMCWGNIGLTFFIWSSRSLYLLGAFGENRDPSAKKAVSKKKQ